MKFEALKLADELSDKCWQPNRIISKQEASDMIRRLVAELDSMRKYVGFKDSGYDILIANPQTKPLSDEEIYEIWSTLPYDDQCPFDGRATYRFARAIEERHGIK